MALPKRQRLPVIVRLNPKKDAALVAKVERLKNLMGRQMSEIINEANREGLRFIQEAALGSVRSSMRQSRTPFRTGTLERAIVSDEYSAADGRGIRFLIDDLIREDVPYYAAIEYGDDSSVGRQIPFVFLGTKRGGAPGNAPSAKKAQYANSQRPNSLRGTGVKENSKARAPGGTGRLRTDRIVGPREIDRLAGSDPNVKARRRTQGKNKGKITGRGVYLVTIKRPVPDYHYAAKGAKKFIDEEIYGKTLDRLIESSALSREGVKYILRGR